MKKVKLNKKFGLHKAGETLEVNDTLYKHLKAKRLIDETKPKKKADK